MASQAHARIVKFMLDSNVVIAVALATGEAVRRRMAEHDTGDFAISSVTFAEVVHGSARGKPPELAQLQAFIEEVPVLPFDEQAARAYATIPFKRASYDRLIAAHALSLGLTMVTDNPKHFADVPGLVLENWTI
jgi:tRNA(fMet)-specific endonuclease VapC